MSLQTLMLLNNGNIVLAGLISEWERSSTNSKYHTSGLILKDCHFLILAFILRDHYVFI